MAGWEPVLPSDWDHSHRAFLQALMCRGTVTFGDGRNILAAILSVHDGRPGTVHSPSISMDTFKAYMSKAREVVAPLDYDIRSTYHQVSREQVWALVNAHSDPCTQLASSRGPDEIAFVKRILDAMFETYNTPRQEVMAVTAAQARSVARPPPPPRDADGTDKGLKHSDVERLMRSLVDEGWLDKSDGGFYTLGARSLMELNTWLVLAYNDPDAGPTAWQRIKFCEGCKDIVTVGQRCPDRDCHARFHNVCADTYWRTRRGEGKCPKCGAQWTGRNYVGEKAVTETAAALRRAGRKKSGRRTDSDIGRASVEGSP